MTHDRFNRKAWAFKHDFNGALAKWLVKQSPYVVPDGLSICIEKFDKIIAEAKGEPCYIFEEKEQAEIEGA